MRGPDPELDPLDALLKPMRVEWTVPPDMRARALARASAVLEAEGALPIPIASRRGVPSVLPAPPVSRPRLRFQLALAASVAMILGALGAVAALRGRGVSAKSGPSPAPRPQVARAERDVPPRPVVEPEAPAPAPVALRRTGPTRPVLLARPSDEMDAFTGELKLLQQAQAAYTRRDFSGALAVVGEHARRFPKGRLAEEREALRVRSLFGANRQDEAHRAAAAFGARFPRSVLLPRLEDGTEAPR